METVSEDNVSLHCIIGSSGSQHRCPPPRISHTHVSNIFSYLFSTDLAVDMDIIEIVGGEGGASNVCTRRAVVTDMEFDLVTGCDLRIPRHREAVFEYIRVRKPMLIITWHPCTGFASWSYLSRYKFPGAHVRIRGTAVTLVDFAVEVAMLQVVEGRHRTIENTVRREMS